MGCRGLDGGYNTLKKNYGATPNYITLPTTVHVASCNWWRGVAHGSTIILPPTTAHHMDEF